MMCPVKGLSKIDKPRVVYTYAREALETLLCFEGGSLDTFCNVQFNKYKEAKTPMWNSCFQITCMFLLQSDRINCVSAKP